MEVQTETSRPIPTAASKPVSLFDKLMINSAARQAGALAGGTVSQCASELLVLLLFLTPVSMLARMNDSASVQRNTQ